jgi:hypothetical protein
MMIIVVGPLIHNLLTNKLSPLKHCPQKCVCKVESKQTIYYKPFTHETPPEKRPMGKPSRNV